MALIDNVLAICRKKGIKVSDLERRACLPENSIYKWKNHSPSIEKVQRVADVLQKSVDEICR